nr:PREDICTED: zinc finger and BTB domain-containing protein 41-like [Bemisia tabaci]
MAQNLVSGEGNQKSYQSDWYAFKHFAFLMGKSWKSDPTAENDEEDETESDARDGPIKTDDKDTESENEDDSPEDESEDESMEVPLFEDPPSAAQKELPSETKNTDDAPDAPKLNEPQPQAHHDDDQEKNDQEAETSKTDEPDQVSQNSASTPEDASSTKDGEKKVVPLEAYVMKHCPSEFAAVGVAAIKVEYEEDEIIEESTALPALFAKSSSYKIDYHPMKSRFPINDLDSLEAFDKELQDNPETFSLLVEFLNLFDPSATPSRAARKRMRYMVSKSLLTNMNYKKHWKKPCMENRKITDAIFKSLDAEFDGKYDKNTVDSSFCEMPASGTGNRLPGRKFTYCQLQPFACPNCSRTYKYKDNLMRHLRLECGVEPKFPCSFCPYKTKHKTSLKSHMRIKHSVQY